MAGAKCSCWTLLARKQSQAGKSEDKLKTRYRMTVLMRLIQVNTSPWEWA